MILRNGRLFMEKPLVPHNSASKCRNAAKVRGVGKGQHERTEKIPRARRVCGSPRGQTRLQARTPGRRASAAGGDLGTALPRRTVPGKEGRRPTWVWGCIVPVTTYPVFLAPGGDCKPLFIPSYRIHGGFSRRECLNVPPALHPKGLPTQKGPPVVRGCLLALKSRFLNGGRG